MEKHQDQDTQPDFAVAEARPCRDWQQRWVGLVVLVVMVIEMVVMLLLVKGAVMVLLME